jgi:hypothetical protein
MSTINILAIIPNRTDATSLYRGLGPLSNLRREMDLNVIFCDKIDDSILDMVDLVFMQRPAEDYNLQVAKLCQQNGTPLWIDYDDLLLEVPEDNPAYDHYSSKEKKQKIMDITKLATCVTVSTEHLKRCLQNPKDPLNHRVFVVPNALPDKFLNHAKKYNTTAKHVNWRGTNTHQRDLAEFAPELIELANERVDMTMTFIGYNPWFITQYIEPRRAIVAPPMTISDYVRFMSVTNPPIQIVPLHKSNFNMCKSNIAWLESCLVGAICIGPEWQEWTGKPGILTYKTAQDFKACIGYALDNPDLMAKQHAQSWAFVKENLILSKVNVLRRKIIHALNQYGRTGSLDLFPSNGAPERAPNEQNNA